MSKVRAAARAERRPGRPRGSEGLSRAQILSTAVDLAQAQLGGTVSVRAIAARLGVSAMAIYAHIENKSEIDRHIMAQMFSNDVTWLDIDAATDGPTILRHVYTNLYDIAGRHAGVMHMFMHNPIMPDLLRFQEHMYEGFRRCGLPPLLFRRWARIFSSFVTSSAAFANLQKQEAWQKLETAYHQLDATQYPNLVASRTAQASEGRTAFLEELESLIAALLCVAQTPATKA